MSSFSALHILFILFLLSILTVLLVHSIFYLHTRWLLLSLLSPFHEYFAPDVILWKGDKTLSASSVDIELSHQYANMDHVHLNCQLMLGQHGDKTRNPWRNEMKEKISS